MKVAIVGLPKSGKSTVFAAVTGLAVDPFAPPLAIQGVVRVPDPRLKYLIDLYKPKKVTQAVIEWKLGQTYEFAQLSEQAIEQGQRCFRIVDEQGFAFWVAAGIGCQGIGIKQLGRYDEAIDSLQDAIAKLLATGSNILFPKLKGHLADALWQIGRRDEALSKLDYHL